MDFACDLSRAFLLSVTLKFNIGACTYFFFSSEMERCGSKAMKQDIFLFDLYSFFIHSPFPRFSEWKLKTASFVWGSSPCNIPSLHQVWWINLCKEEISVAFPVISSPRKGIANLNDSILYENLILYRKSTVLKRFLGGYFFNTVPTHKGYFNSNVLLFLCQHEFPYQMDACVFWRTNMSPLVFSRGVFFFDWIGILDAHLQRR